MMDLLEGFLYILCFFALFLVFMGLDEKYGIPPRFQFIIGISILALVYIFTPFG